MDFHGQLHCDVELNGRQMRGRRGWCGLSAQTARRAVVRATSRRGISSVLSMMFLVLFSSLTAAMAVVAQGNLRTADSYLHVSRAMSAAETGLIFATRRLESEAGRFVVEKGTIDQDYGHELWLGTFDPAATGPVIILDPEGYVTSTPPDGLAEAVYFAHLADSHTAQIEGEDPTLPSFDQTEGVVRTLPITLSDQPNSPYFKLKYERVFIDTSDPDVEDEAFIRVTSQGVDGDIRRTLEMDFKIDKKIEFAVLSPNRIMIGKNVRIEGPLGSRYGLEPGELDTPNGDPLVMRSDFYYLNSSLDTQLDTLYSQVVLHDVDGDGRLRPDHPTEALGLNSSELIDYNGDEYVDDFDLFLAQFDNISSDGRIELASEFAGVDDQLASLIDEGIPDRDFDGDIDSFDSALGYNDGFIDSIDLYAKVHGRLGFAIMRDPWDVANDGDYQSVVAGPVRPDIDDSPVTFEVTEDDMREITTDMVATAQDWLDNESATGDGFAAQISSGGTVLAADPNNLADWEAVPYNATGAYDFYNRTEYHDFTFDNVRIPMGNNGLFVNCTFKGVTYIEAEPDCTHVNWNYAGAKMENETGPTPPYVDKFPGLYANLNGVDIPDTRVMSNNIRFHNCTFIGSVAGDAIFEYTHWRNKIQFTGDTRFYIDEEEPELNDIDHPDYEGAVVAAEILSHIASLDPADVEELEKSSILMPGWSVDVGSFVNELGSKVKLKGTIISGIFDVRGTVDVHGTLLMTFRPRESMGPLYYGGLTDAFNTTIGYFGPSDGDGEGVDPGDATFTGFGEITLRYNPDGKLPDGIPWPISMAAQPLTYVEGGSL